MENLVWKKHEHLLNSLLHENTNADDDCLLPRQARGRNVSKEQASYIEQMLRRTKLLHRLSCNGVH